MFLLVVVPSYYVYLLCRGGCLSCFLLMFVLCCGIAAVCCLSYLALSWFCAVLYCPELCCVVLSCLCFFALPFVSAFPFLVLPSFAKIFFCRPQSLSLSFSLSLSLSFFFLSLCLLLFCERKHVRGGTSAAERCKSQGGCARETTQGV